MIAVSTASAEDMPTPVRPAPAATPLQYAPGPAAEAISAVLTPKPPDVPSLTAAVKPKPRTSATERGDVDPPRPRPEKLLPASPPRKAHPPTPPQDHLPTMFSAEPEPPPLTPLPPEVLKLLLSPPSPGLPLPTLSHYVADRVPLTDPTAVLSYSGIVFTSVPGLARFSAGPSPVVPDPFVLGEQVRPRPAEEIGLTPPRR